MYSEDSIQKLWNSAYGMYNALQALSIELDSTSLFEDATQQMNEEEKTHE